KYDYHPVDDAAVPGLPSRNGIRDHFARVRKIDVLAHRCKAKPARSIWCILPWALRHTANNFSAPLRRIPANPSAMARQCPRPRRGAVSSRRQRDKISGWSISARHPRSEEHTSELQSPYDLVCRLLLEKK